MSAQPHDPTLHDTLVAPALAVTVTPGLAAQVKAGIWRPPATTQRPVLPQISQHADTLQLAANDGPRYHALRTLGRGGMGEVDLVEDRDIGRSVAVKRLLPEASTPDAVARFAEEVRTIGRLEHPNIVPIHDVGVDADGRFFFVMKFVDGETLESIISRLRAGDETALRRYDIARRVQIFIGILRALAFAHGHGVLHRDIKPANVMVGPLGEVVLMDWGVACPIRRAPEGEPPGPDPLDGAPVDPAAGAPAAEGADARVWTTRAGDLVGTPHYMAPEQAIGRNDTLDERSDLYAACVLFHELLGLRHRHEQHTTLMAVLMAVHREEAPSPMRILAPHPAQPYPIPAEYGHLLHRGLQRAPADRWQSADALIAELEAILRGECRVQCPVTFSRRLVTRLNQFLDRRQMLGAAAILLSMVGVFALVVATAVRLLR